MSQQTSSGLFRLKAGGRIDRSKPITFRFNDRIVRGFEGDSVASALLANGIRLVGRSFKYHRPRGVLSHGSDEPNALVSVNRGLGRRDPNNRATMVEAVQGLVVKSQNHWPSLRFDFGAINDVLSALIPAGFYYKTFMWPASFWRRVYEPRIRAAAGLGVAPTHADADWYAHRHAHCDVLVVGGGPAGIAAALAAAQGGQRVMLVDEQAELGGTLLHDNGTLEGLPAAEWLGRSIAQVSSLPNVRVLTRTTATGYYDHNHLVMVERVRDHLAKPGDRLPRERLWQVRARRVILAAGALERPLAFSGNDRPGIMLAESIRAYINRYGVAPGRRLVLVTNSSSAYRVAVDAQSAGVHVTLVDLRGEGEAAADLNFARMLGIETLAAHRPLRTSGRHAVKEIVVAPVDASGALGVPRTIACDCIGLSGGWTPTVHLFSQSRGTLRFDEAIDAFVPDRATQPIRAVGAANGCYSLDDCIAQGRSAGSNLPGDVTAEMRSSARGEGALAPAFAPKEFVDFQNDVTSRDIALAAREGFTAVEHVKRYTTIGMATDQGKTSNMAGLHTLSRLMQRPVAQTGVTTFRAPFTPVTFGAVAGLSRGDLFAPVRETPMHGWSAEQGAVFENVGLWRRAWYYPQAGESMHDAVRRECRAVRQAVGIFDATTLGKIEVVGPDAAEFMNRIYINGWLKLEPGRCRYGIMLREDGYVFDDGVVARLAPDRFHVTTTTGGAPAVLRHMEDYLQTEWPDLQVFLTSTTEQWAVIAVQGPRSREVLAPLVSGIDMSPERFPHMSMRSGHICGIPTRLFRVSFTGELGYEINVPSDYGCYVWEAVFAEGRTHGITPYGTEAMHVLRAERGFIIVGQETDGSVTVDDLGLSQMVARAKPDFVGKRSMARPDLAAAGRQQLVGLLTDNPEIVLDEGAQIVTDTDTDTDTERPRPIGRVTSSYWSEACGRSIALALVEGGRDLKDRSLGVTATSGFVSARVTDPIFVDEKGERANA